MADQTTDLSIVIEAVNKATATLKQVEKDLGGLAKAVGAGGETAATASMGFGQLVAGVATGTVVATIAMAAFQKLFQVISQIPGAFADMVKTASEIEGVGIAMHVVANNAGITAEAVDKVRDSVVEQNVTTGAANRLMTDLIRNQLEYTQATELASAAQNIAVASGVSSSETIERISEAIASGMTWNLRQLGLVDHLDEIYERYGQTLGKTSQEMTQIERRQAVVNYVLQEGEKYAGAYDAAMMNASKVMRSTSDRVKEISYNFGKIFEPAMYQAAKAVYDFVNSVVKWAHEHEAKLKGIAMVVGNFMKGVVDNIRSFIKSIPWDVVIQGLNYVIKQTLQFGAGLKIVANIIQIFVRFLDAGISTIVAFGSAMNSLANKDFKGLVKNFSDYRSHIDNISTGVIKDFYDIGDAVNAGAQAQKFTLEDWWKNVKEVQGSGWKDIIDIQKESLDTLTSDQKDKLKKMLRDIEKENQNYAEAVSKRAKDFQQSFDDLVISHRDKIKELTADLESENKDYKQNLQDLLKDYNSSMDDIEARHKEKTKSVMDDMEEERKKAEEEIEKITEAYNEETGLISKEGEDRVSTLKAQLDRERALGNNANQKKIDALEEMIAYEQEGLAQSLDDKQAVYDEEVSDVNTALDDKLEKLKQSLLDEDTAYADSFAKRKQEYADDLLEAKTAYDEKKGALQKSLDEETAIQKKYADDFKRLADTIAADDITRLVSKYNDEKTEMEREHQEKLADIKYQAFEGGEEYGSSYADGLDSTYPQVKASTDRIVNDLDNVTNKLNNLSNKATAFYSSGFGAGGGGGGAWAEGGIVNKPTFGVVGESGAEAVLPLSDPKRMAMILKTLGIGGNQGGGSVNQTFYVTVKSSQDVDVLMERAGFAMRNQGGYK